ncbi:MAG TPA: hypothetical protein VJZ26_04945 [Blastocatellia bacterium]|nr:hypothetical protein [Blastocatellia bacterium]
MSEEGKQGLKIFLEFWLLIAVLAGFNFYMYFGGRSKMFLVVGIISAVVFVGWAMFYYFYVRKGEQKS